MAVNPNWPMVVDQIAFTGDPNDPNATPAYTDITARVRSFETSRGRQYEIDQNQTGEAHLTVSDKDEVLNPANTSAPSPYQGNIKPYRRYVRQAQWPPTPIISADQIVYRQTTWQANGSGLVSSSSIARPSDLQVGDDIFLAISLASTATITTAPSGFTLTAGPSVEGTVLTSYVYHKVATSSDVTGTGWSWTYSAATTASAVCVAIDGLKGQVQSAQVIAAANSWYEGSSRTAHPTPTITTTLPQSVLISVFAQTITGTDPTAWTGPPSGDTLLGKAAGGYAGNSNVNMIVCASPIVGAGSYSKTANSDTATINCTMAIIALSVDNAVNLLPGQGIDPSFESYASGSTPSWVLSVGSGVNPTVTTANPQAGTKSLTYNVTAGGGTNGVGLTINCIPGQQYTGSVYVQQSAANTTQIFINGGAGGSSTAVTGSYVRLSVSFTASAPTHQLWVCSFSTSLSGSVYVDAFQLEPGATATTFSANGPTIYTPFSGYVERWPTSWNHQGTYGLCTLTCVDAMAILAGADLHTEFRGMLASKKPDYWWPLDGGSNTTTFAETSGNNGAPLVRVDRAATVSGSYGTPPTITPGTSVAIAGDPGATGTLMDYPNPLSGQPVTFLQTGTGGTPQINVDATAVGSGVTVAFWASWTALPASQSGIVCTLVDAALTGDFYVEWYGMSSPPSGFKATTDVPSTSTPIAAADSLTTGVPHLVVATLTTTSSGVTTKVYLDGSLSSTSTTVAGHIANPFNVIEFGAYATPSGQGVNNQPGMKGGTYAHLAVWKRELSAQDVTDLWNAGKGYPGETSGARISRLLSVGGYTGPTAIDSGQSTMDVSTVTEGAALLDACQAVTLSENGNLYVEGGVVTAKSRADRYLKTTATWVFGERADLGEYPYEADIAYDYDPTRVVNDVTVTRVNGVKANAIDATSQKQYFRRSYQRTVGIKSDLETIDASNYLLNKGKQPIQRIARLSIKPSANPALWPIALGARIGDRVTVKRRTPAFTMSSDFFIEKIDHSNEPGSWVTDFQMSPVDRSQVWILGDATYGALGTSTILGY